jgi:hypothetical protein
MKETSLCSFDSTWLLMVRLAKGTTTTQPVFNFFIKMKMVVFIFVVVVAARSCFVVARDSVSRLCASLIKQVSHALHVAQMSRGCIFYYFFASFSSHVLLLFLMFLSEEI